MNALLFRIACCAGIALGVLACDSSTPPDVVEPIPTPPVGWQRVSVVPPDVVDDVSVSETAIVAVSVNRVFATGRSSARWTQTAVLDPAVTIAALTHSEGRLWAGTLGDGIFQSRDGGRTWRGLSTGLSGTGARRVLSLTTRGEVVYAGTDGASVFRFDASRSSWVPFRTGIPSNVSWNVGHLATAGSRLVVGAGGNGNLYVNESEVDAWTESTYEAAFATLPRIVHEIEPVGTVLLLASTTGLYRSTDGGRTWTRFDPGMGVVDTATFAVTGEGDVIVAVSNARRGTRLFVSEDAGATWRSTEDLPGVFVMDLEVADETLYAARFDGLWTRPLTEILEASE